MLCGNTDIFLNMSYLVCLLFLIPCVSSLCHEVQRKKLNKLDKRFAKIESGTYVFYSIDEMKHKLSEKLQRK